MPTKREREYYRMGFLDGQRASTQLGAFDSGLAEERILQKEGKIVRDIMEGAGLTSNVVKPKRKLSAWQKYIKNKRNHIKYRDGKLNLKKMGVAFRRKQRR
jgi:hypothetical protein